MEFGILGPLEVRSASGVVPIRRGLPRTIVVALVVRRGHTVTSDFLVDLLWGDDPPRNPANALQIQVSYLRKTLGAAQPDGSSVLETRAGGYALVAEPEHVDAHRFETAARSFTPVHTMQSQAELVRALDDVERALGMWRGDALEDVAAMEFARGEVTRLEELRVGSDGTPGRLAAQAGPARRHGRRAVGAGSADAAARAVPRAARTRSVPLRPPSGRSPGVQGCPADAGRGARHRTRLGPA